MNSKSLAISIVVILAALAFQFYPTGYGELSREAYDLALASYGACVARSEERIDKIETMLDASEFAEKLSPQETRWFRNLISQTRSDRWEQAEAISKRMMEDQVKATE